MGGSLTVEVGLQNAHGREAVLRARKSEEDGKLLFL
jgi:hypothetical protein